jgi:hypothetical protein
VSPEHVAVAVGALGAGSLVVGAYLAGRSHGERYGRAAAAAERHARQPAPHPDLYTTAEIPPETLRRVRESSRPSPPPRYPQ